MHDPGKEPMEGGLAHRTTWRIWFWVPRTPTGSARWLWYTLHPSHTAPHSHSQWQQEQTRCSFVQDVHALHCSYPRGIAALGRQPWRQTWLKYRRIWNITEPPRRSPSSESQSLFYGPKDWLLCLSSVPIRMDIIGERKCYFSYKRCSVHCHSMGRIYYYLLNKIYINCILFLYAVVYYNLYKL